MGFEPPILSYGDVREYAEEFLGEFHSGGAVPTPIEEGDQYFFFEYQSNSFAGLILAPPPELKARFTRRVEEAKAKGLKARDLLRHPLRQRLAEGLAGEFEVSDQTMAIRLERDGLLPPLSRD